MKKRHLKTLESVFKTPVQSNVKWSDIEKLLEALGAELSEGNGSRVRIVLNGVRAVFHIFIGHILKKKPTKVPWYQ